MKMRNVETKHTSSRLQIIFFNKKVICQVRDQTSPDKETVWLDKKNYKWKSKIKNLTNQPISLL